MQLQRPYDYDRDRYGHILDWDQYSFKIDGKRVFLFSGEFHYWRLPDRDRWRDILLQYKSGGLNCIRIYFHWGFHSPSEKKYVFTGNRDLEYLFNLCEELGLYVLCAPGPYICAETTAGGYPPWLLARDEINIRHQKQAFVSRYDPAFAAYSRRWLAEFLPHMLPHERTTNPGGCVIGLQIENEHIRKKIFQFGLDEHMNDLANAARELGATTPLFHNDAWEMGSWAGGDDPEKEALTDIYGFDRYIIWCPREYDRARPPRWKPRDFAKSIAGTEKRVRAFGGRTKTSPIFLVELQGGWFNQWGHDHGFDEVYDFYGDEYTRTIAESFINEGSTMLSMYMYYGGTNWGSLGDPDVYTSYDYGACVREFGYQSDRLRKLRLSAWFTRGFEDWITSTDATPPRVTCDRSDVVSGQRQGPDDCQFIFLRNFNADERPDFRLDYDGIAASGRLAPRASMIAVARLKLNDFYVELCSLPWITRVVAGGREIWVFVQGSGDLVLRGPVQAENAEATDETAPNGRALTRVRLPRAGTAKLTNENGATVTVLALSEMEARSLAVDFESGRLAWGAYSLVFSNDTLIVETAGDEEVKIARPDGAIETRALPGPDTNAAGPPIELTGWRSAPLRWGDGDWKSIKIESENDPMQHGFHSGHTSYRCTFVPGSQSIEVSVNARHRATVWCNGRLAGGQITYSYSPMTPGAKNGPDLTLFGSHAHSLREYIRPGEENEIIVLCESLGYNRGPFAICDFRNPRGILHTKLRGNIRNEAWSIAGVDVTARDEIFNTAGLPGEAAAIAESANWRECAAPIAAGDEPLWYRAEFQFDKRSGRRLPLRLRLEGRHCAHVFLNGTYIARYWGDFGPQSDFYLMDELLVSGANSLVFALYTKEPGPFSAEVRPYRIEPSSGNIDETGPVFVTAKHELNLN